MDQTTVTQDVKVKKQDFVQDEKMLKPDYIFEASWEVCNKVGGIHTVITSKSATMVQGWGENYITVGPDVWKGSGEHPEFIEDADLFLSWKEQAASEGLRLKIGRWKFSNYAIAILIDFTPFFHKKDEIFTNLWTKYHLDSLTGQWDYIEPAMFGYAAGKVIESFYRFHLSFKDKIIAQFHEWMTGTGVLYLHENVPQIGTVLTTHATVVGRSIAGNGLPLYAKLKQYNGDQIAKDFNVLAKQSLEKRSAQYADCFTTVSEITAQECVQFLEEEPDIITPNGFEIKMVPGDNDFEAKRNEARNKLLTVARALAGVDLPDDTLLLAKSGRYEFRNKGIDVFIDAIGKLNKDSNYSRTTVAFIMVPAHHTGPRREVQERMQNISELNSFHPEMLTHYLQGIDNDPVMNRLKANNLANNKEDKVKVIFVPTYLHGDDGIFNAHYYDLIIGFDLSVFPSYYEPWGYTPLESMAFHIPTITTQLAGFGKWMRATLGDVNSGIFVIDRSDNDEEVTADKIAKVIFDFSNKNREEISVSRESAFQLSKTVQWSSLISYYRKAYDIALQKSLGREYLYKDKHEVESLDFKGLMHPKNNQPKWRRVFVQSEFPKALEPLQELSKNLWWSWNYEAESLFEMIDEELWDRYKKNPVAVLEALPYAKLKRLEKNQEFLEKLQAVYDAFKTYMSQPKKEKQPRIAYLCMEYGLNQMVRLYSGGLGILAGDYLKEASDANVDMVGVGLLYRHGYFKQTLSKHGEQLAEYKSQKFSFLPILPVRDDAGNWLKVSVALPGRRVYAKIWKIDVGRVPLYLLDTDIEENNFDDRFITYQLYGGDHENRLKQEMLLGIGGNRLLQTLNIKAAIYHCNEGHAAFVGLERMKNLVMEENISFTEALDIVRASTLFTTHTPVPAGHDVFSEEMIRAYLAEYATVFNIGWQQFVGLGRIDETDSHEKFSMSHLAARVSQEINGVSEIHGRVSQEMLNPLWPGFMANELHVGYVTNGVHYQTWTAKSWQIFYRELFGREKFSGHPEDSDWEKILIMPDDKVWEIRTALKRELKNALGEKIRSDMTRRHENPRDVIEILNSLDENTLTIGFARRFATYKRAHLLFHDMEKLKQIISMKDMPVQFLFAGKAHPKDKAGQDLIKRIVEISELPAFRGKVIFIENYDMEVAKYLVQGVDVWLNNPERPMEASGTSGMKAALNGVLNLSVLDGWWAEGYLPGAGWALPLENTYERKDFQDELDSEMLYNIIEKEVIPMYYERNNNGLPEKWIDMIRHSIANIAPKFTTKRMISEYVSKYYAPMYNRSMEICSGNFSAVRELCGWKKKVISNWNNIKVIDMTLHDSAHKPLLMGEDFQAEIVLSLGNLKPEELGVEVLFIQKKSQDSPKEIIFKQELSVRNAGRSKATYETTFPVTQSGVFEYGFRIFPKHPLLPNKMDFNLVKWV